MKIEETISHIEKSIQQRENEYTCYCVDRVTTIEKLTGMPIEDFEKLLFKGYRLQRPEQYKLSKNPIFYRIKLALKAFKQTFKKGEYLIGGNSNEN